MSTPIRLLFRVISLALTTGIFVYALVVNNWVLLGGLVAGIIGTVMAEVLERDKEAKGI